MALLSVVIPSKDNQEVLERNVDEICQSLLNFEQVELVIHDNSALPSQRMERLADVYKFVNYIHTSNKLSVGENFSLAFSKCKGDFLACLGDDDKIVIRNFSRLLGDLKSTESDVLHFPIYDMFFWAGSNNKYLENIKNNTYVRPNFVGKSIIYSIFRLSWATRFLKSFWILAPDLGAFPRAYFGVTRSHVLLNDSGIIKIFGSPDSFLMGKIAATTKKISLTKYDVFLPGTGLKSTSNLSNARKHSGLITEQSHLTSEDISALPNNTPNCFLPEVIWSASYLAAQGIQSFGTWHLAFLSVYVALKYRVSLLATKTVRGTTYGAKVRWVRVFMAPIAVFAFLANRAIIAFLLLARYKLMRRSSE